MQQLTMQQLTSQLLFNVYYFLHQKIGSADCQTYVRHQKTLQMAKLVNCGGENFSQMANLVDKWRFS